MKLSCRFVLISLFFLLAWLAPVTSALAANEVFLSNDTVESEATYVVQFEATVKGNIDKIKIKLPPRGQCRQRRAWQGDGEGQGGRG